MTNSSDVQNARVIAGVSVPDSPLITEVLEYAQKVYDPYLFNHAMWIGRTLLEQVDRAELDSVALVTETNDAFKISLREGQRLDDLELALLSILPVESARIHKR